MEPVQKKHPTPIRWMGKTLAQEHILRYLDREDPYGQIMLVMDLGPDMLEVTDARMNGHLLRSFPDGSVAEVSRREMG